MAMTEKQKMLAGKKYLNTDKELSEDRWKNRKRINEFNDLSKEAPDEAMKILSNIFQKTGKNFEVMAPFQCDYGYGITVGNNFFANYGCTFIDVASITFGDNCLLGPNCQIYTVDHAFDVEERNRGIEIPGKVTIGDNLWAGGSVVITPNVTLGNNVIIAAGAVVTKSFGDNVLIGGNPAHVIKELK